MCVSTLPSPSLSVPCIWGILQSPCRKSTAFSAKDHFAKVFSYSLFGYLCGQTCGLSDTSSVFYGGRCLWRVHPPERLGFALDARHRMDCCDPQVRYPLGSTSKCNTRGKSLARVPRPHPPFGGGGGLSHRPASPLRSPQMKRGDRSLLKMSYFYIVPNISIYV